MKTSLADRVVATEHDAGVPMGTVNFSVRLPTDIAVQIRVAADREQLPTSVWLRRVLAEGALIQRAGE